MSAPKFRSIRRSVESVSIAAIARISLALVAVSCSGPPPSPPPDVSTVDQPTGMDVSVGTDIVAMDGSPDIRGDVGLDVGPQRDATVPSDADASMAARDASFEASADSPTAFDADASSLPVDAWLDAVPSDDSSGDGGDGTSPCLFPFRMCPDGTCANVFNDPNNCGVCGTVCPAGQICAYQGCAPGPCNSDSTLMDCEGRCVLWQTDPLNCGTCGNVCPPGIGCMGGQCSGPNTCAQCEMNNLGPAPDPTCTNCSLQGVCTYNAVPLLPDGGYTWMPDAGTVGWGCDGFTGTDQDNCNALLACLRASQCIGTYGDVTPCLCGTLDLCTCVANGFGSPQVLNGPCVAQYIAAAGSGNVFYLFTDPHSPVGIANNLAGCDVTATCSCP